MSSAALEAAFDQLARLQPGPATDQAVAALVAQGDAGVTEIGKRLAEQSPSFGWRHNAVQVLQGVNSEGSRAVLRRMALGEWGGGNPNMEAWAAQALMACDPAEAWALLTSRAPGILVPALNALKGQPVDAKRLALLKTCLPHRMEVAVSWRAAEVMAHGSTGNVAREAVAAIGEALSAVAADPKANTPYPRAGGSTFFEAYGGSYLQALLIVHVDNQVLHDLARRFEGRARDVVLVALARRGDRSVHDEMVRLVQDPEAALAREWASRAFEDIGRPGDLPLLRTLAKTDPLLREGLLPAPHPIGSTGPTHPVRQAAQDAIRVIEKKAEQPKE
jgi:hypothetical protein